MINALDGGLIEELVLSRCSITDISTLGTVTLPCLKKITLDENRIGREGVMVLSNLLQQEGTTLASVAKLQN